MSMHIRALLFLTTLPMILMGCGSGPAVPAAPAAESPEQLVSQWMTMASGDREKMDTQKLAEIVQKLAAQGPDKLTPLLDVLADKDADPGKKVLVVVMTMPFISQSHEPRLIELTGTQIDSVSRGCAAHLLGVLQHRGAGTPAGLARIRELMVDTDRHVSSAAILVMEQYGDPDGVAKAIELWSSPEATAEERNSIVLNMPQLAVMKNTKLFAEAVLDAKLPAESRSRAIKDLGIIGDASVLDALKKCAETETDPALKEMAKASAEAVEYRAKEGLVAVPISKENLPKQPAGAPPADPGTAPVPAPAAGS